MTPLASIRAHAARRARGWWMRVFAAAMLLKAAVPLLAVLSAGLQDVALADVCSVYGVRAQSAVHGHGADLPGGEQPSASAGHGEHCALAGVLALGAAAADRVVPSSALQPATVALPQSLPCTPGAEARWQARHKQDPPAPLLG